MSETEFLTADELVEVTGYKHVASQRPADVLKMRLADIKDGAIEVQQNKTKKKLRILLDDEGTRTELGKVIDRIKGRERKIPAFTWSPPSTSPRCVRLQCPACR